MDLGFEDRGAWQGKHAGKGSQYRRIFVGLDSYFKHNQHIVASCGMG